MKAHTGIVALLLLVFGITEALAQPGSLKWFVPPTAFSAHGPATWSTPVLSNGNIIWQGQDGDMYCFNAETGALVWKDTLNFGGQIHHPVVNNGTLYTTGGIKGFCAVNVSNGTIKWNRSDIMYYLTQGTPVLGSRIFVGKEDTLYCLNTNDGSTVWYKTGLYPSYILLNAVGTELLVGHQYKGKLSCIDPLSANGSVKWELNLPDSDSRAGAMALKGDSILVLSPDFSFLVSGQKFYAINIKTQQILWLRDSLGYSADYAPPAILDSLVVISSRINGGGQLHKIRALSLATGKEKWQIQTRYASAGRCPIVAALDGKVFVNITDNPALQSGYSCIDAHTGNILWNARGDSTVNYLTWGGLVLANNKLYASPDHGGLYCFDAGMVKGDWRMFGCTPWLSSWYAEQPLIGFEETGKKSDEMRIHPNPFTGECRMEFTLQRPAEAMVDIFNYEGRLVQHLEFKDCKAGCQFIMLSIDKPGLYFYVLQTPDLKQSGKLMVAE